MPIIISLLIFLASATSASASTYHGTINSGEGLSAVVIASPSANPGAGTYTSTQSVTLSAEASDGIRYTIDGSTPSCGEEGGGTVFSSPIDVSSSLTIQAISCYSDASSSVASFTYVINIPVVEPAPTSGGGGGGGNGPIVGLLPPAGSGNAPAPSITTESSGENVDTNVAPAANDVSPIPVVADPSSPPDSGNHTVAVAPIHTVPQPPSSDAVGTSSQLAAAASVAEGGPDYWWMLLLLLLFLLLDAWWVLNSRKFPQHS